MSNGGSHGEMQMHFQPRQREQRALRWPLAQGEGLTQRVRMQQPPTSWGVRSQTPRGVAGQEASSHQNARVH